ncbi:hypothetical protein MtrunA17_Chr7g0236371 [Medicago truncatula]|uniref:Uncharacterized protein n=1 Tax=Medicago truncatula TaxID=3880 RepID=A0A396H093_MEDTR|nr:hypothetical protein MtrunA17_Chr7g0236371 [Medicago truncatula]
MFNVTHGVNELNNAYNMKFDADYIRMCLRRLFVIIVNKDHRDVGIKYPLYVPLLLLRLEHSINGHDSELEFAGILHQLLTTMTPQIFSISSSNG